MKWDVSNSPVHRRDTENCGSRLERHPVGPESVTVVGEENDMVKYKTPRICSCLSYYRRQFLDSLV